MVFIWEIFGVLLEVLLELDDGLCWCWLDWLVDFVVSVLLLFDEVLCWFGW